MSTFKLNPLLVETLVITQNYENGFEIKCLSKSTDMSELLEQQLAAIVKHQEAEEMCHSNLLVQTRTLGFNHVEFLIGAKDVYDHTDNERALTWLPGIVEGLKQSRAFVPS